MLEKHYSSDSQIECVSESIPGGLIKTKAEGTHRVSGSVGQGQSARICISSKSPGDGDAAGLGTTLREQSLEREISIRQEQEKILLPIFFSCVQVNFHKAVLYSHF